MTKQFLVFTDLDGTLLDHDTYQWDAAGHALDYLEKQSIPVIPTTSKTFAEVQTLRQALNNRHPFIVENGAAVFIPHGYFPEQPQETHSRERFWVHELAPPRAQWVELLVSLKGQYQFENFAAMSTEAIASATGLSVQEAALAAKRDYGEPVQWLDDDIARESFIKNCQAYGARVLAGGRFLHLSGATDKGRALKWLTQIYQHHAHPQLLLENTHTSMPVYSTIALGDSHNDVAMLAAADFPVVIASRHKPSALQVPTTQHIYYSQQPGPRGWQEAIEHLLIKDSNPLKTLC